MPHNLIYWVSGELSSVLSLSCIRLFVTPWTVARQASLSITNSWSLFKLISIKLLMSSNHFILCRPLLLLPSIFLSISVQDQEIQEPRSQFIRWPKYWSFSFSISSSNKYSGLISFRMDWLDLLAVQGTLKSLLQHHSSKASILLCSAFFIVQLSHPYMTTGKTIALIRWTFVGKVISLLFNMLSRLVIAFLPRCKCLLISWLQSPSAVILEPSRNGDQRHFSGLGKDPGRLFQALARKRSQPRTQGKSDKKPGEKPGEQMFPRLGGETGTVREGKTGAKPRGGQTSCQLEKMHTSKVKYVLFGRLLEECILGHQPLRKL